MKKTPYIWKNGKLIDWESATTHVLSHALHYGTGVFEGIRAYETAQGPAIFRVQDHYQRLLDSGKLNYMVSPYSIEEWIKATILLIQKNKLKSCYIRPLLYFGYGKMGLNPEGCPLDATIAAWEWGTYLGEDGLEKGIRCKMSSYIRPDSRCLPPLAKSTANYINSAHAKREAVRCGYDEAILLNTHGRVAEGPGENIFVIKDNKISTPPSSESALHGITCQTLITLAQDFGYEVVQKPIIRDELMLADELFFTGTAAEVTPIREIDGITIGSGTRGPITAKLQSTYFDVVTGKKAQYSDWLTVI